MIAVRCMLMPLVALLLPLLLAGCRHSSEVAEEVQAPVPAAAASTLPSASRPATQPDVKLLRELVSRHFVICHDGDESYAASTAEELEQTLLHFYGSFAQAGFVLKPIDKPLLWLCFDHEEDLAQYARQTDKIELGRIEGYYYSSRTNRVALNKNNRFPEARVIQTALSAGSGSAGFAGAGPSHELAHQLAFNSGLQVRGVMYPLWVSEGLATNFESTDGAPAGLGRVNIPRLTALLHAMDGSRTIPLGQFVSISRIPAESSTKDAYAQCWGLFHFLLTQRPAALQQYLMMLAQLPPGSRDEGLLYREFEECFGPPERLQQQYVRFIHNMGAFASEKKPLLLLDVCR